MDQVAYEDIRETIFEVLAGRATIESKEILWFSEMNAERALSYFCSMGDLDAAKKVYSTYSITLPVATIESIMNDACKSGRLDIAEWLATATGAYSTLFDEIEIETLCSVTKNRHFEVAEWLIRNFAFSVNYIEAARCGDMVFKSVYHQILRSCIAILIKRGKKRDKENITVKEYENYLSFSEKAIVDRRISNYCFICSDRPTGRILNITEFYGILVCEGCDWRHRGNLDLWFRCAEQIFIIISCYLLLPEEIRSIIWNFYLDVAADWDNDRCARLHHRELLHDLGH